MSANIAKMLHNLNKKKFLNALHGPQNIKNFKLFIQWQKINHVTDDGRNKRTKNYLS